MNGEQIASAKRMWADGFTLGEIARSLGVSVYQLSPWLYADDLPHRVAALNQEEGPNA